MLVATIELAQQRFQTERLKFFANLGLRIMWVIIAIIYAVVFWGCLSDLSLFYAFFSIVLLGPQSGIVRHALDEVEGHLHTIRLVFGASSVIELDL